MEMYSANCKKIMKTKIQVLEKTKQDRLRFLSN